LSTIRTYRAATVREALSLVRADLGDEALILGQREIRKRPFPWRKVTIESELTAACPSEAMRQRGSAGEVRMGVQEHQKTEVSSQKSEVGNQRPEVGQSCFNTSEERPAPIDPFRVYTQLIDGDVDEAVARQIVGGAQSPSRNCQGDFLTRCRETITRTTRCGGPIQITPGRRRIAALVGGTGVGKTTTVAKLAANFRLRDRVRVGLITVDTYRVAAIEQLRTYADLIGVPMQVVTSPREMPAALDELTDVDLVLIDTAGRSPGDDLRIQELRSYLQAAQADEVHLVASLTAGLSNLMVTVERFSRVGPTALLLTKLDEAAGPGAVVSAAGTSGLPLSYITTGQDVPDDIEIANAERIAHRVLPQARIQESDFRSQGTRYGNYVGDEATAFSPTPDSRPLTPAA
jgi:flagellar biosynthesis protein FlhF